MRESKAETKWCPFVRVILHKDEWHATNGLTVDADDGMAPIVTCVGRECMAWRVTGGTVDNTDGCCGLISPVVTDGE